MRNLGDLVPMPLPQQWAADYIPPGSLSTPQQMAAAVSPQQLALMASQGDQNAMAGLQSKMPNGARIGWQQVNGGWILACRFLSGAVHLIPGAVVVPYPGASSPLNQMSTPNASAESDAYRNGTPLAYPGGQLEPSGGVVMVPQPTLGPLTPPGSSRPGFPFGRQPILPDSALPPALQRSNPGVRQTVYYPNAYDRALQQSAARWSYVRNHGGLKSCCRVPSLGAPVYDNPPWMVMPSQGEPFNEMFSLPIGQVSPDGAGGFSGVDTILGSFQVDNGYDGAINRFVCQYVDGAGFVDFSGFIVWRLQVGNRFARNLGNVQNTFGSYQAAFQVPGTDHIRLVSGQTVYLIANIPIGSPVAGGFVTAGAFGWFYPRR